MRSEYCDALRPGFESHRSEKEKAQRRRTFLAERQTTERIRKHAWVVGGTAVPLSSLQATDEEDDDFADRADWLQGRAFSPSQRDLVERVAVHYSLTPHEWRQGLLFLSFDSAFLDRLAGQKRGWANKRKQRLLANVSLTPKAHRLLAAHEAVQNTISTQSSGWSYVAGLRGRSFPGAFRIRAAKEKRLMQNGNGHKPAGSWSVWTFTAYEPDGPATWWAYQNGAAPIYARTKKRLVEKALAEARLRESFQLSNPASTSSFQSGSYRMIGIQSRRDRVDRSVIRIFDAWADSAEVKPVLGRIQRDRGRPDFDLYLHCGTTAQPSEEWDTWIPPHGEVHRDPLVTHKGLLITRIKLLARQVVIRLPITVRAVPARVAGSGLFREPASDARRTAPSADSRGRPARGEISDEDRSRLAVENGSFGVVHGQCDEDLAPRVRRREVDGLLDRISKTHDRHGAPPAFRIVDRRGAQQGMPTETGTQRTGLTLPLRPPLKGTCRSFRENASYVLGHVSPSSVVPCAVGFGEALASTRAAHAHTTFGYAGVRRGVASLLILRPHTDSAAGSITADLPGVWHWILPHSSSHFFAWHELGVQRPI